MKPEYARRYQELYERHWWWRARERFVLESIRRIRPSDERATILDVGCGDGLLFDQLAEFGDVQGVESDTSMVGASSRHRARIHVGPFDASFQPGSRYSLILMLDVIEHFADPASALRQAVELLEPNGILVATLPAFRLLWTTHDDLNHHFTRYTRRSFGALADDARLQVIRATYFFHWVFAAKLVVRLFERLMRPEPRLPRMPPAWLNELFYEFSRLEQRLVTPLDVPFGSSLLVIGRLLRT